jgi:hypothetical protein
MEAQRHSNDGARAGQLTVVVNGGPAHERLSSFKLWVARISFTGIVGGPPERRKDTAPSRGVLGPAEPGPGPGGGR